MGMEGRNHPARVQGYILIFDFEYALDRYGNTYGWGIARYAAPENFRFPQKVY